MEGQDRGAETQAKDGEQGAGQKKKKVVNTCSLTFL